MPRAPTAPRCSPLGKSLTDTAASKHDLPFDVLARVVSLASLADIDNFCFHVGVHASLRQRGRDHGKAGQLLFGRLHEPEIRLFGVPLVAGREVLQLHVGQAILFSHLLEIGRFEVGVRILLRLPVAIDGQDLNMLIRLFTGGLIQDRIADVRGHQTPVNRSLGYNTNTAKHCGQNDKQTHGLSTGEKFARRFHRCSFRIRLLRPPPGNGESALEFREKVSGFPGENSTNRRGEHAGFSESRGRLERLMSPNVS